MADKQLPSNTVARFTGSSSSQERQATRPPSQNGFRLSTQQLHQLLSQDNQQSELSAFDKALRKQKQLLKIVNTLEARDDIQTAIDDLITNPGGIDALDSKISQFKSSCPPELLSALRHCTTHQKSQFPGCEAILHNYHCLINELIVAPLQTLSRVNLSTLSEFEREDWYQWCCDLDRKFDRLKTEVNGAMSFFSSTTFEKLQTLVQSNKVDSSLEEIQHFFSVPDAELSGI